TWLATSMVPLIVIVDAISTSGRAPCADSVRPLSIVIELPAITHTFVLPDTSALHCSAPVPLDPVSMLVFELTAIMAVGGAARQTLTLTPATDQQLCASRPTLDASLPLPVIDASSPLPPLPPSPPDDVAMP